MKPLGLALVLASFVSSFAAGSTNAADCQFVLGFKALRDMIPNLVGDCKAEQHYNPQNGDALQETTRGLLVWRKADNFTAFTDGYRTWVNGPYGLQQRLNTERFDWERPEGAASSIPAAAPVTPPAVASPGAAVAVLVKDFGDDENIVVMRGNDELWVLEARTYCFWTFLYEGEPVVAKLGMVSSTLVNSQGQTCGFWTSEVVNSSTLAQLDGVASIVANDGQFLGKVWSNRSDASSLVNRFGPYGNKYSAISVLNKYGNYGSKYSSFSPFNKYTSTPPLVVVGGEPISNLSVSRAVAPRINPYALFGYLAAASQ